KNAAEALGLRDNLPNADSTYLVQNGTAPGSVSGSNERKIARNQLPNATLNGSTNSAGSHSHSYTSPLVSAPGGEAMRSESWIGTASTVVRWTPQDNGDLTTIEGAHSHSFTTSSINGGVTQQNLNIAPRSMSVNMFIFLGAS